jgi:UDP-glucose 4-epimerase
MRQTILITGAAGFIGGHAARHFAEQDWEVIGIDQIPPHPTLQYLSEYYELRMPHEAFSRIVQNHLPQVCIHCAGPASVGLSMADPSADFYGSTVLTFEILNTLRLYCPTCRFVMISSAAVYGNPYHLPVREDQPLAPLSPYGFHKWQCEQLCQEFTQVYGLPTASVRIFSAYGRGLKRQVLWDICRKSLTEDSLTLQGTGKESRDFVHILDIARALSILSMKAPMKGETYNLGSGQEVTIARLAETVLKIMNISKSPEFNGIVPPGTPLNWCADISRLTGLGFTPKVSLEQGIEGVATWCRSEGLGAG